MNCIIVDDEPLARKAIQILVGSTSALHLVGNFGDAISAGDFMKQNSVDLVFLDIRMPEIDGLEFAKTIDPNTLIIFTTAYSEYALDSYEVDAVDYLVKPVEPERFQKAIEKAISYHSMLLADTKKNSIESITTNYIFVKSDRRYFKILFSDILFVEGLKDYVVIQTNSQRIITKMNLKAIHEQLPGTVFFRVSKSYIINILHIESLDNNNIFMGTYEIPIGNSYRDLFFEKLITKVM